MVGPSDYVEKVPSHLVCKLVQVVSFMAHIVLMRPQCYPTLVALEPCGPECIQESFVFRIDKAVRRM
jgi:hypothetical protein